MILHQIYHYRAGPGGLMSISGHPPAESHRTIALSGHAISCCAGMEYPFFFI